VTTRSPLLIIGGGIGGITAALALADARFAVHLVERAPEVREISAGIQLAPNALRILDALAVLPDLAALAVRPRRLILMHADSGRDLTTVASGSSFERRYGYAYTDMHRSDLLAVLHKACQSHERVTLESRREVTGHADTGGAVRVSYVDQERPVAAALAQRELVYAQHPRRGAHRRVGQGADQPDHRHAAHLRR
jgi:3-hydroxybenzoate 6-monooxygenase